MFLDTKEFMAALVACTPNLYDHERIKLISRWTGIKNIPENRAKLYSGQTIHLYNDKWDAITDLFNYLEKESGKTVDKSKFMFNQNPAAFVNRAKATNKTTTTKTNKAANEGAVTTTAYNIAEIVVAIMTQNKILQAMLMEMRDLSGYMQDICRELNIEKSPR